MDITQDHIPINQYSRPGIRRKTTLAVTWHWVGKPMQTARAVRDYFASLAKPSSPEKAVYGSAQFIIGMDGEILQTMPLDEVAYHAGSSKIDPASGKIYTDLARKVLGEQYCGLQYTPNHATIGIELCHKDWTGEFSNKTLDSLVELTAWLFDEYRPTLIDPKTQIVRHYDLVGHKTCPLWFCDHPDYFAYTKERVRQKLI